MYSQLRSIYYDSAVLLSDQFAFGMREVLLLTHGVDPTCMLRAKLVHGETNYNTASNWPTVWHGLFRRFPILSWSVVQKKYLETIGFKEEVIAVGAPFLHLLRYVDKNPNLKWPDRVENSLLYIPNHSHPGFSATIESALHKELESNKFSLVTVCLFWLDFINPMIRGQYTRLGVNVTCVGYKGNASIETPWADDGGRTNFLPSLANLIAHHEYVITDTRSVSFFYAAVQGRKVKYLADSSRLQVSRFLGENNTLIQQSTIPNENLSPAMWYDCSEKNPALDSSLKYLGSDSLGGFLNWIQRKGSLEHDKLSAHYVEDLEDNLTRIIGANIC